MISLILSRKHSRNRTVRKSAVSNFTTSSTTHKCHLTNRKRRKVIVEHEAFFGFPFEAFETLHVVTGTERSRDQGLGFTAGEDSAAMHARQDSRLDPDFANLVERSSVWTAFVLDHLVADDAPAPSLVVLL